MQQNTHLKDLKLKVKISKKLGLDIKKDDTYIIPIFIPHRGCKNECVFCNQRKISGEMRNVTEDDVRCEIDKYLKMYKDPKREKQIAFFGGSFTGLDIEEQVKFLNVANEYIKKGLVKNIRISTRPDYITELILKILKGKNVEVIELGVQSMADDVLEASKRGHTSSQVIKASNLIKKYGFKLGHQIMIGLPKSTKEKEIYTVNECIKLKPDIMRIYPVYVLKDSKLYEMYESKEYKALELNEAVERVMEVYNICVKNKLNVIRIGLQTTEEINSKNCDIKGPVCDNYKERVLSLIAKNIVLEKIKKTKKNKNLIIVSNKKEVNYIVGPKHENVKEYESEYKGRVLVKIK